MSGNNYPQSYPVLEDMLVNTNSVKIHARVEGCSARRDASGSTLLSR